MNICGYQKTTLLDYPGHVAATIFTGGCNFRCPFCHNSDLVVNSTMSPCISQEEIFSFLKIFVDFGRKSIKFFSLLQSKRSIYKKM